MYFSHFFGTISLVSFIVSASIDYSDFALADDESELVLTSLPIDQLALSNDELSSPLDQTTSLFDEELPSSSPDPFTGFDVSSNSENTSSDLLWDDSFKLASCSTSEVSLPPALGKSRVRRADDSSSCANPDHQAALQAIENGKFSLTCTLVTAGVLPFAMAQSDSFRSEVVNTKVLNSINPLNFGPRLYYLSTLYRATLRKKKIPSSSPASTLSNSN